MVCSYACEVGYDKRIVKRACVRYGFRKPTEVVKSAENRHAYSDEERHFQKHLEELIGRV